MDTAPLALDADPGKSWRRLARAGAVFSITVQAARHIHVGMFWSAFVHAHSSASSPINPWVLDFFGKPAVYLLLPVVCLYILTTSAGLFIAISTSPYFAHSRAGRLFRVTLLSLLTLLSVGSLFYYGLIQARHFTDERIQTAVAGVLMAFLLLGALALLQGWHERGKSTAHFWPGLPALVLAAVVGLCLVSGETIVWLNPASARLGSYYLVFSIGDALAFLAMLLGWLMWWRALAKHERAQKAAEVPAPAA